MSDYHVLNMNYKQNRAKVAFHISIPDTDNFAGKKIRDCLYKHLGNTTITSVIPNFETDFSTEYSLLQSCTIFEYVEWLVFPNANATNQNKRDIIVSRFNSLSVTIPNMCSEILEFYDYNGNV